MKGRKPKASDLRRAEGVPGHRAVRNEPKARSESVACPRALSPGARREWRRLAPELSRLGILSRLDSGALSCYCEARARFSAAMAGMSGESMLAPDGRPRPEVRIARDAAIEIRHFGEQLGLTPLARTRLNVRPEPASDEEEVLANQLLGPR